MTLLKKDGRAICNRVLLFSGIFVISIAKINAQEIQSQTKVSDSAYVEKFDKWINIKLALINTSESYVTEGANFRQELKANPSQIFRTYINYRFIAFYVDYIPHFLPGNNDEEEKGRSKGLGFGTGLTFHNWFTEIGFSHTKGYYLENTKDYRPDWQPGDPYFQVPDFHVTSIDGATGYNTNPHLSLVAASSQTARQMKSAGAFIPKVIYRYLEFNDKTVTGFTTQKARHFRALLGAGYHHSLVLNKSFYVSGSFTPYFGYILSSIRTRGGGQIQTGHNNGPVYQWDARLGLGYNGHRFFAGTYLTAGAAKFSQGLTTATLQDATVFFQIFAGLRLHAPKFLDKAFDKL